MKKLNAICALVLILVGTSTDASAEVVNLRCKLDRGWDWNITLDLEADTLAWFSRRTVPIVEKNEGWIVAFTSDSAEADETKGILAGRPYASTEQWVINRFTGELWSSHFNFFLPDTDASNGAFLMAEYRGLCARQGF